MKDAYQHEMKALNPYQRYLRAELRAWGNKQTSRAITFARLKARAYRMYAITTPYY